MNDILSEIIHAKHIMIVTDSKTLAGASAVYTHILRLHKKVSLVCDQEDIDQNLSFLPWFDKIRTHKVSSADFIIEFNYGAIELYDFLKKNSIKINPKMATALYGGLLQETKGFLNSKVNGIVFAMAKELIECGGDYKICNSFLMKRTTLAALRLKAIMLKNLVLCDDAKVALFCISRDDFKSSGASIKDCDEVLEESLKLPYTELALLLDADKEYEALKIIYKEQ